LVFVQNNDGVAIGNGNDFSWPGATGGRNDDQEDESGAGTAHACISLDECAVLAVYLKIIRKATPATSPIPWLLITKQLNIASTVRALCAATVNPSAGPLEVDAWNSTRPRTAIQTTPFPQAVTSTLHRDTTKEKAPSESSLGACIFWHARRDSNP
jgi:hypothetical protein